MKAPRRKRFNMEKTTEVILYTGLGFVMMLFLILAVMGVV